MLNNAALEKLMAPELVVYLEISNQGQSVRRIPIAKTADKFIERIENSECASEIMMIDATGKLETPQVIDQL